MEFNVALPTKAATDWIQPIEAIRVPICTSQNMYKLNKIGTQKQLRCPKKLITISNGNKSFSNYLSLIKALVL